MANGNAFDAITAFVETIERDIDRTGADLSALVDMGARIKSACDKLAALDKACKARILDAGEKELRGDVYCATVSESVRFTLDSAAVKAEMGDDWCAKHSKQSLTRSVRYGAA